MRLYVVARFPLLVHKQPLQGIGTRPTFATCPKLRGLDRTVARIRVGHIQADHHTQLALAVCLVVLPGAAEMEPTLTASTTVGCAADTVGLRSSAPNVRV